MTRASHDVLLSWGLSQHPSSVQSIPAPPPLNFPFPPPPLRPPHPFFFKSNPRIRHHTPQPKLIPIRMVRPLMLLILNIQPHDPPIRVLTPHDPSLNPNKHLTPPHPVRVQPRAPRLQVRARPHTPRDGVPALLRGGLGGRVAHLDEQLGGGVEEHLGEEGVLRGEVVELGLRGEGEDGGVEVVGCGDGVAGEFEVIDAVEGRGLAGRGWHGEEDVKRGGVLLSPDGVL